MSTGKEQPERRRFRVVVVGAGIAGLTLSNALQRAGIDHVVLEKHRQVVYPSGASIGIWPNGSRLLSQLGCLQLVQQRCSRMQVSYNRLAGGETIITSKLFDAIVKRHGYEFYLLERMEFIRALYEGLPSAEPIKTGLAVSSIEESEKGVRVYREDGSFEDGDIVVGCDGVGSPVRQMMWEKANAAVSGSISTAEMKTLTTRYKCLYGLSPIPLGLPSGIMTVVHLDGSSILVLTQPTRAFYFVFSLLDKTYTWPALPKYTSEDVDAEAARVSNAFVHDGIRFGDIWKTRLRGGLINIEEGVYEHWHAGRIVLLGDAAHKFTVNVALGGNAAMDSAATLANCLRAGLMASPDGLYAHPSQQELSSIFQTYQRRRVAAAQELATFCTMITRVQACENTLFKFMALRIFPLFSDSLVSFFFSEQVKRGVKLEYLPVVDQPHGTVVFEDEKMKRQLNKMKVFLGVLTVAIMTFAISRLLVVY